MSSTARLLANLTRRKRAQISCNRARNCADFSGRCANTSAAGCGICHSAGRCNAIAVIVCP